MQSPLECQDRHISPEVKCEASRLLEKLPHETEYRDGIWTEQVNRSHCATFIILFRTRVGTGSPANLGKVNGANGSFPLALSFQMLPRQHQGEQKEVQCTAAAWSNPRRKLRNIRRAPANRGQIPAMRDRINAIASALE